MPGLLAGGLSACVVASLRRRGNPSRRWRQEVRPRGFREFRYVTIREWR